MRRPADNVDEYLDGVESDEARASLEHLRNLIHNEIPSAQETISYGIPVFKLKGYIVGFAAFKNHCSLFPGGMVADFAEQLSGYKTSKGTIQFTPENPLPDDLILAIVRARVSQDANRK